MSATASEVGRTRPGAGPWRQPVVWLAASLFFASLAGCVLMIVLAMQYPDPALEQVGERVLKVPVLREPLSLPSPSPAASGSLEPAGSSTNPTRR